MVTDHEDESRLTISSILYRLYSTACQQRPRWSWKHNKNIKELQAEQHCMSAESVLILEAESADMRQLRQRLDRGSPVRPCSTDLTD